MELLLDGAPLAIQSPIGTQLSLTGIAYGSHTAQARILDPQGKPVAATGPVSFHLLKPFPPGVIH
jgi:hypothetical protein